MANLVYFFESIAANNELRSLFEENDDLKDLLGLNIPESARKVLHKESENSDDTYRIRDTPLERLITAVLMPKKFVPHDYRIKISYYLLRVIHYKTYWDWPDQRKELQLEGIEDMP